MKTFKWFWIPRVLAIIFVLFLSLFALDSFSGDAPFIKELAGFLIHLIPSFILVIILAVSWGSPMVGGLAFVFSAIVFTWFFRTYRSLPNFLIVSFPLVFIGALFITIHIVSKGKVLKNSD